MLIPATRRTAHEIIAVLLREAVEDAGGAVTAESGKAFVRSHGVTQPNAIQAIRHLARLGAEPGFNRGPWVWFTEP